MNDKTDSEKDIISGRSYWRGHSIIWLKNEQKWVFENDHSDIMANGGEIRPCVKCGKIFNGSNKGKPDACIGTLPGVDNACCGHGIISDAYIRFTNGVVIKNFTIEVL